MGKFVTIMILVIAAYAVDAYAFGGRYADYAMQQVQLFSWEVKYRLKKIGI
jgi:ABC-type Fe3+ transport system permease subunit